MVTRYDELRELVSNYGQATVLLMDEAKRFGHAILRGLPDYLGCDSARVKGVPPTGSFNVRGHFRDDIFSFYHDDVTFLEPVTMGLYVEVANRGDRGATWVIFGIEFWVSGTNMLITVAGNDARAVAVSREGEPQLEPVFEVILAEVRAEFAIDLDSARGKPRIGFIDYKPTPTT